MSVIQTTNHPATGATETFAKGTIKRINIKRLNADGSPKVSTFKDKNTGQQKQINSTHMYSVLLEDGADGAWISFGTGEVKNLKYEDQFQIKTADGKYVDLLVGMLISVYPVSPRTYEVNGETKTAYEGKKKNLAILDSTNAVPKTQQGAPANAPAKTSATGGATTKVYGEILTLDGTVASVKTENGEVKVVTLTQEQVAAVQIGGRLTGKVDGSGKMVSGFKAYGPEVPKPAGGGNKGFKKDDLAIRLGNALTITHAMFPEQHVINLGLEVTQTLSVMDNLRSKLAAEFTHMDAHSLGARLGQSGILSAPFSRNGPDEFAENTEGVFRMICAMEDNIRKDAEQAASGQDQQGTDGQGQQQVQTQQVNTPAPEVAPQPSMNYAPNPSVLDFDDDIPFAPIGLQYADHFIHSM